MKRNLELLDEIDQYYQRSISKVEYDSKKTEVSNGKLYHYKCHTVSYDSRNFVCRMERNNFIITIVRSDTDNFILIDEDLILELDGNKFLNDSFNEELLNKRMRQNTSEITKEETETEIIFQAKMPIGLFDHKRFGYVTIHIDKKTGLYAKTLISDENRKLISEMIYSNYLFDTVTSKNLMKRPTENIVSPELADRLVETLKRPRD